MKKRPLFYTDITPCCGLCQYVTVSQEPSGRVFRCSRKGEVAEEHACRRFRYDPLKRRPKRPLPLPEYDPKEFEL